MKKFIYAIIIVFCVIGVAPIAKAQTNIQHSPGTTFKDSKGIVWFISESNCKASYTSAGAFLSYGYNSWSKVVQGNSGDLNLRICNNGETHDLRGFIAPQNGKIICSDRGSDKGTCYLIVRGLKVGFTSENEFKKLGFKFENVIYGDTSWISENGEYYLDKASRTRMPGVLINDKGTVKLVELSDHVITTFRIPDMKTFNSWGFSLSDVIQADEYDLLLPSNGPLLNLRRPGQLYVYAMGNLNRQ